MEYEVEKALAGVRKDVTFFTREVKFGSVEGKFATKEQSAAHAKEVLKTDE